MATSRRSYSLHALGKRSSTHMTSSAHTNNNELSTIQEPPTISTSAHTVHYSMPSTGHTLPDRSRPPSPPASSYFPFVADTQFGEPQPAAGASSHFAYSTTLRRHRHSESIGFIPQKLSDIAPGVTAENLLQKALGAVTGRRSNDVLENGYSLVNGRSNSPRTNREERRDTPSARFAHWSIEVCQTISFFFFRGVARVVTWLKTDIATFSRISSTPFPI